MIAEYTFPCGCKFKQCGTTINETGLPSLDIDLYNLPHCPSVYKMLQEGKTKGVFQLETSLGHTWCKKLEPNNILDLAALISVIRPGVLKAFLDGKSMTQHFCDRKNGREDVIPLDPSLTEILRDTYQIQVYQEQSIRIAIEIAGFDEVNGDKLRKCIAKGSWLLTQNGPRLIEDVYQNQKYKKFKPQLLSLDNNNKLCFSLIKNITYSGKQKVREIKTKNGYIINITDNHQIFTQRGWIDSSELKLDDFIVIPDQYTYKGYTKNINEDLSVLMSYIIGEGYHVQKSTYTCNKDPWIISCIERIINKHFGENQYLKYYDKNTNVIYIKLKGIARKWAQENIPFGLSNTKVIPQSILNATNSITQAFIGAYFSGEGWVSGDEVAICSTSKQIIEALQLLLLRDGIFSAIDMKKKRLKRLQAYILRISGIQNIRKFTFTYKKYICPTKYKKLLKLSYKNKSFYNEKLLVPNNFIRAATKNINVSSIYGSPVSGTLYNSNLTYDRTYILNQAIDSPLLSTILNAEYKFVALSYIKDKEEVDTYDFELDSNNHYGFINGILVHNSIGTKDAKIMNSLEEEFITGCKKVGKVSDEMAKQIFAWIRESQKYNFNLSHGVSYATLSYINSYIKYHFPLQFFTSWLHHAKEKLDPHAEIRQLVAEAKLFDINIYPPTIKYITEFNGKICIKNKCIFLGLENVKGCGGANQLKVINKIRELEKEKSIDKFEWLDILVRLLPNLTSTAVKNMIRCGVFDIYGISRTQMLFEYQTISELTKKESELITNNYSVDLINSLISIVGQCTKKRVDYVNGLIKALQNPPIDLKDTVSSIISNEKEILGVALTSNYLDSSTESWSSNTCRDYLNGNLKKVSLSVEIKDIKTYTVKSGKNQGREQGYISIEDSSGAIDSVKVFCDTWNSQRSLFYVGAHLLLTGEKSKYDDSLVIYSAKEI